MSKNKLRFFIGLAACIAAFLVISFAVPFVKTATYWISFAFGLAALLLQACSLPRAMAGENVRSKFYGFPILKISLFYLAAQLICSLAFMAAAKLVPGWIPAVISALMLCAALVGFVSAEAVREEAEHLDREIKKDVSAMRALQSRLSTLSSRCPDEASAAEVEKLREELRFSDPVSSPATAPAEAELSACIDTLLQAVPEGSGEEVIKLCRSASAALSERNRICRLNK